MRIHVISDATGETAERVVRAAMVQFDGAAVTVVRRRNIRTPEQVRAAVAEADAQDSIVVHSLVSDKLRRLILEECRLRGVDSLDMLGPLLDRLALHLKLSPQEKPGLLEQLQEAKSRAIEAVEFAFRHDDGQNAEDLDRAEIVLVGVSRTMKTPTMLYLAYRGWFVANVPLVPGLPLPRALAAFSPARVILSPHDPRAAGRLAARAGQARRHSRRVVRIARGGAGRNPPRPAGMLDPRLAHGGRDRQVGRGSGPGDHRHGRRCGEAVGGCGRVGRVREPHHLVFGGFWWGSGTRPTLQVAAG